jgi:putative redox protein
MDVVSILRKKRQNIAAFEIQLEAQQADEHPRVFTHIDVKYIIRGKDVRAAAVERAIDLSVSKYCSAQAMLAKSAVIEHTYEIIEEE